EVTELRRHSRWASVFLTLKDPTDGSCVGVTMPRGQFDGLRLDLVDGERVHLYGRPELFEKRGDFRLRALTIERFGIGPHLAAVAASKTCCRSATRASCARSPIARCRSSPRSGTSRTRRSAISLPTFERRPRRPRAASSFPTLATSFGGSIGRGRSSREESAAC